MTWLQALLDLLRGRVAPVPAPGPPPGPPPVPAPEAARALLALLNAERSARGLPPLARHAGLDAFATEWAAGPRVTTADPHGDHLRSFFARFPYARSGGEIIAPGYPTPAEAVHAWMSEAGPSKPHRDAILSRDFTDVGIGVADHDGLRYWVCDLAAF